MIHILLLILKAVGIIILSIFIILGTLLLLVLFVPVRYRIHAEYRENISAVLKISWLFHILSGKLYYIEDSNIIIRLLGIPVYNADKKEERKAQKEERKKEKEIRKKGKIKAHTKEKKETGEGAAIKKEVSMDKQAKKESPESYDRPSDKEHEDKKTVRIFFVKIRNLWIRIIHACKNIKYTLERIYDKIRDICNNINYYYELVHSVEAEKAYALCKKQIIYLWKNIRPRNYKAYLHVGNEDPAMTGQIMALYGMLYPLCTDHVVIVPEFEQDILEGNLFIKGKITIFGLLRVLWVVYFDKNLRLFLSMLKKEE